MTMVNSGLTGLMRNFLYVFFPEGQTEKLKKDIDVNNTLKGSIYIVTT